MDFHWILTSTHCQSDLLSGSFRPCHIPRPASLPLSFVVQSLRVSGTDGRDVRSE